VGILSVLILLLVVKSAVRAFQERAEWVPEWVPELPEMAAWVPLGVSVLVSGAGIAAVFLWLLPAARSDPDTPPATFIRRYWVLVVVVVAINGTWHFFRAWLPLFLQDKHGYTQEGMSWFMIAYYLATDAGTLTAGFAALALARRGLTTYASRLLVFTACAAVCTLGAVAPLLPDGLLLMAVLLALGFAALGLFPVLYSFGQDLTTRNQGKVTGALGCSCWLAMAPVHEAVGDTAKATGSYAAGMTAAGLAPLVALAALALFWGGRRGATAPVPAKADLLSAEKA
jgi:ACS family hexuronate transporter-like MFS transporter